jgi:hypothetical protein
MAALTLDVDQWAQQQFGTCDFGDRRRTKRMVKLAAQAAAKPDASTPEQAERWADCKAAYRLFDQDEVTFAAVTAPHGAQARAVGPGTWLVLNDATELCFGYQRDLPGAGRVGGSLDGRGFYLHTALIVSPDGAHLVGAPAQELYARPLAKIPRVGSHRRKQLPARESDVWGRVIDATGRAPQGARFLHVCDRGADNFDVYCHLLEQGAGWVIRAAQLARLVRDEQGVERTLEEALARGASAGRYELTVRANREQPARTALLDVRSVAVALPRPRSGVSRYAKERGVAEIPMWAIEVREVRPPRGATPLRWVLLTSERAKTFNDAWRIIEYYERRPLIEEYHKCLKTGCRVESRLYHTGERLAPVIGLLAVLAVRLLQLKLAARTDPDQPAAGLVPAAWLKTLPLVLKTKRTLRTLRDFFRALASLGGFLGRKSDGDPGWQTVWRGLQTLLLCLRGAETVKQKCG